MKKLPKITKEEQRVYEIFKNIYIDHFYKKEETRNKEIQSMIDDLELILDGKKIYFDNSK